MPPEGVEQRAERAIHREMHAHTRGYAVAGVYSYEIAETKVNETMALASKAQFPLLCTLEPE